MQLKPGFTFVPLDSPEAAAQTPPPVDPVPPYGYLSLLPGHWAGTGFNMIWRPFFDPDNSGQNRFLELNLTNETFDFALIDGAIPNRGRLQGDIDMYGLTYLQQVSDANLSTPGHIVGLHAEPGVWANVPATTQPEEPPTVVRMASIPHGTAIIAQGTAVEQAGVPDFSEPAKPYPNAFNPKTQVPFNPPEQDLSKPTPYRTPDKDLHGITQAMLDRPVETVLKSVLKDQNILSTVTLAVSTLAGDKTDPTVSCGGGTANTAFLAGGPDSFPNAAGAQVDSTFWIERVQGEGGAPDFLQLQYRQTVFLLFDGLFWPHVSVATLRKQA